MSSELAKTIPHGTVKGKKEYVDRRKGGNPILKCGQEYTFPAQLGQLKTGKGGTVLLPSHLWGPNGLARFWNRKD